MNEQVNGLVARAQSLVDGADAAGRHLSTGELAELRDLTERAELARKVEQLGVQLSDRGGAGSSGSGIGGYITGADAWNTILSGLPKNSTISLGEYMAAAGDPVLESTGNNADGIAPMWIPRLATPSLAQEIPSLASLFAQGTTDSNTIRYMKVVTRNAPTSAVTVESQEKPGAEFAFDDASATLQKLAVFVPVSEEMLEDSPSVRDYLNAQLPLMVQQAEDKKLAGEIYTAATGVGLSTTIGGTDANGFDAIADAIKDVQINGQVEPDGLFINPTDYWTLAVKKSTTSGDYYSGGPYAGAARNPWGLRTVISQRAPAGFPLVGNFRQGAEVWRKGGIRLEASNSHLGFFRENLIALRAETRVALTVYDGAAFSVANLAS